MVFNSYEFVLLFLPVFVAAFYLLRRLGRNKGKQDVLCKCLILAASSVFFALFGIKNAAVLGISIFWNIGFAIPMAFMRDRNITLKLFGKEVPTHRFWLILGICGNLTLLLFFKLWGVFLPIAISFYTFNQLSYLIDLYRGDIRELKLLDYLVYVLFFPKLLQGPLMDYGRFEEELKKACGGKADYETILRGLYLFSMGLFKKVLLADTFGKAVDVGFDTIASMGSIEAILTAVFYSFQLYFDFSGYCDMAAAVCLLLGFELPVNFNSPYKATSIVDFWKRWHITLTRFFTQYVYIPLGGNRKGQARMYANFMIVFLLSGFWHGTGITFIIWGAMHGVLYVITRALGAAGKAKMAGNNVESMKANAEMQSGQAVKRENIMIHGFKVTLTFVYVTIAWVFFRANTVSDALSLIKQMFVGGRKAISTNFSSCFRLDELWYVIKVTPIMKLSFSWDVCLWLFLIGCGGIIFFGKNALQTARESKIGAGTTLITLILIVWSVVSLGGVSTFLYMNF